jgi:hypothetical protein
MGELQLQSKFMIMGYVIWDAFRSVPLYGLLWFLYHEIVEEERVKKTPLTFTEIYLPRAERQEGMTFKG